MNRSDADILWEVASVLARDAANVSRAAGRPAPNLPPLLFFTDPMRTPRPWETAARLPAGSGVVFRAFGAPDARETGLRLREATLRRDGLLLVGLDPELAEAVEADGVHLPERALGQAPALAATRPDWRITGALPARLREAWTRPRHGRWTRTAYYAPPEVAGYLTGQLQRIRPRHPIQVHSLPDVPGTSYLRSTAGGVS